MSPGAYLRLCGAGLVRFGRDERASVTVESVIILPVLLWAFLVTYSWFDAYRVKSRALKANYAISDLMSRETRALDRAYLNGIEEVYELLTGSGTDAWVRVTVVRCVKRCDKSNRKLDRDWSKATDNVEELSSKQVRELLDPMVPVIPSGERVIVVETNMTYNPPFSRKLTGVGPSTLSDIVMTRPRFAPQLCWEGENCGT